VQGVVLLLPTQRISFLKRVDGTRCFDRLTHLNLFRIDIGDRFWTFPRNGERAAASYRAFAVAP
jgi:hypothetical protein